ncbi:YbhB/YbcL family Raf kinase inhibitor-like protein [Brachybacterium sp. AOP25-B2-12]|uniref:YbhB/YbcL family Raf kinase inhibitor-like protein n=1 Tax=Brachybacterium sp. AOP25-B2-12 TaxID=3457710 RepID=UPI004034A6B5
MSTFTVTSSALADGAEVPAAQLPPELDGPSTSPDLTWSGAPEGTRSFAVTCFDPDAPTGSGFWHWVAWDLPADATTLPVGVARDAGIPLQAVNDFGRPGYDGPNPPQGPVHHYVFTVHALPVETLGVDADAPHVQARFAIFSQQLASASVTGTYQAEV